MSLDEALAFEKWMPGLESIGVAVRNDAIGNEVTGNGVEQPVVPFVAWRPEDRQFQRAVQQELRGHDRLGKPPGYATDLLAVGPNSLRGGVPKIFTILVEREAGQSHGRHGVAAWSGAVRSFASSQDEDFVIIGRGKKSTVLLIEKIA